jgi:magnesium chelatase accessory protein
MLLVHGTGASTHSWRDVLPMLAREYSVLAVDLPGHGFTDEVNSTRSSIAGMSESLSALLRALNVDPSYCLGHSAGAVIVCRMALDGHIAPRVIVSINGAFVPFAGAAGRLLAPVARILAASPYLTRIVAGRAGNPANVARIIEGTGSHLDAAGIEFYARLMRNPKHLRGALRMMGHWDLHSFARDLPRLTTPLALMVGGNDLAVPPAQATAVKQRAVNAAIHPLPGLGHLAHEEQPAMVVQGIRDICRAP